MTEADLAAVRQTLASLREKAGVSQADIASRLPFTASRVSRLESGDIPLSAEDAHQLAIAIGTPEARDFAEYLRQPWKILPKPGFGHVSRGDLWEAERALQRLDELKDDPQLKNAFLQQVASCRQSLERAAEFLRSTEHRIAFFGSPGVGKTTLICALSDLRNHAEPDLSRQMVLQTGAGRTTVCEVHVRRGGDYSITVDPCSTEEVRQYVAEFCDQLLNLVSEDSDADRAAGAAGVSAEVERALRNMTGLTIKRVKEPGGKHRREDPALELVRKYPTKEDLLVAVLSRIELSRRTGTSLSCPRDSMVSGIEWIGRTFADINYGRHPHFSLPRRIEIGLPAAMLGCEDLDLRLIDTRGIDEPSAPRRDLQGHLDDERTLTVFCSSFKSAPDAATQAVIERAIAGGLRVSVVQRGVLAVLPQNGEETSVRDGGTGDMVSSSEEGREIRREQLSSTLANIGARNLPVEFLNVRDESDCAAMRMAITQRIMDVRGQHAAQIRTAASAVNRLIANKASEQLRAVFAAATRPLRVWFSNNQELLPVTRQVHTALLEEMAALRYVASLRASVNRLGDWHNFDYWHGLGFGARRETVARSEKKVTVLKGHLITALQDSQLEEAHQFLRQFATEIERSLTQFYQDVQSLGETTFLENFQGSAEYWNRARNRWGAGPGYRNDILAWTASWFSANERKERHAFVEAEVQRLWKEMISLLDRQLESAEPSEADAEAPLVRVLPGAVARLPA